MNAQTIQEIMQMEDGQQIMAVEGKVKFAGDLDTGTSVKGVDWSKQFFVLISGRSEIACTMWDAEGNEVEKGEDVRIEATKNKKGKWTGIEKSSYTDRKGVFVHTVTIQANSVRINGTPQERAETRDDDAPPDDALADDPAPATSEQPMLPKQHNGWKRSTTAAPVSEEEGILATRQHLVRLANLHKMCIDVANSITGPHLKFLGLEEFLNPGFLQSTVHSLFIEASSRRSDDGVTWWSYVDKMPAHALKPPPQA